MDWIVQKLWLIPALPLLAAGLSALLKQRQRRLAASLAIGSMVLALALSCVAFANALQHPGHGSAVRQVVNFFWFQFGDPQTGGHRSPARLGARSADGGDAGDGHVGRPAHLHLQPRLHGARRELHALLLFPLAVRRRRCSGVVIANSLLLLFICWETGRPDLLSADRLLVSQTQRGGGGEEGLHHHAHRRPRVCCSAWCGSTRKPARCSFTTTATAAWNNPRSPGWSRRPRASAWRSRPASGC